MKILVTNDDGIYAPGLWAAVEALAGMAEVVVVAPDREQSGTGTAVTLNEPIRAVEIVPMVEGTKTFAVEGTPADAVILALETLVGEVDLVVAGINSGANLGADVMISGTVGAALQGYNRGIQSIAISVASLRNVRFDSAAAVLASLAQQVAEGAVSATVLLNVNVPPMIREDITGVDVTRLAGRRYADTVKLGDDGKRPYYWITRTRPAWNVEEGTDVWSVRHRRISVTPLNTDITAEAVLTDVQGLIEQVQPLFEPKAG
jgi:5'-nucleotidase